MRNNLSPQSEISFDQKMLRDTLGCFPTGVIVVTTLGDGCKPVGLTINSFSSVSMDPPLISWSLSLAAPSLGAFRNHQAFAINILSADQGDLCRQFARPSADKFARINWSKGYEDVPVLDNALAVLECTVYRRIEGGDHEMYLGEVKHIRKSDGAPLVFHCGQLARLAS